MLKGKRLLDYTNLFSLNEYEKHDRTNIKIFLTHSKEVKIKKITGL